MVDREYSAEDYKSPKINIGTIMRNPVMLKFVPYHLKTKKFDNSLHANDDIFFYNGDFDKVALLIKNILALDLHEINLDNDDNFDEDDHPHTIIYFRLLAWYSNFKKPKALKTKISEKLMPIA